MTVLATERASVLWQAGERWEAILGALRAEGFSKVDCIRATVEQLRLPLALADAKRVVHESVAWADVRRDEDDWQERLIGVVDATLTGSDGSVL